MTPVAGGSDRRPAESSWAIPGALHVSTAVLCPECLGDWCEACDWSGMCRPAEWRRSS